MGAAARLDGVWVQTGTCEPGGLGAYRAGDEESDCAPSSSSTRRNDDDDDCAMIPARLQKRRAHRSIMIDAPLLFIFMIGPGPLVYRRDETSRRDATRNGN